MSFRPCVYISGPITKGDRNHNVNKGYAWQAYLMKIGYAPFNPIATTVAPFAWESWAHHDLWLECDYPWILRSDLLIRLPGESIGADAEVLFARNHNIPVLIDPTPSDALKWLEQWKAKPSSMNSAESSPESTPSFPASPPTPSS